MLKRFFCILFALLLSASAALADGGTDWSLSRLPACYQYPVGGANIIYADIAVPVYSSQTMNETVGTVYPCQHVQVDQVDLAAGMVYIRYRENDTQTGWNFSSRSPKGWVETKYVTWFTAYDDLWVVTTDKPGNRLNLRTKPSADSLSLGKYYAGTIVEQLETQRNGYIKVRIAHVTGYMDVRYLVKGMYTPNAELPLLTVTKTGGTTLRKLPQEKSEIIKDVPYQAVVTVLGVRDDGWVQVMYENEIGYALNRYMTPELRY